MPNLAENVQVGTSGHPGLHNNIAKKVNGRNSVREFDTVQEALDAGGVLFFPAGMYSGGALTITTPIRIVAAPGAILNCISLTCQSASPGQYLSVSIEWLRINTAGAVGLTLKNCRANFYRVDSRGATEISWLIDGGIDSTFTHCYGGS